MDGIEQVYNNPGIAGEPLNSETFLHLLLNKFTAEVILTLSHVYSYRFGRKCNRCRSTMMSMHGVTSIATPS